MIEIAAKAKLTALELWQEMRCLAKSNIADIIDFSGDEPRMRPANMIPPEALRAISSMKVKRYIEGNGDDAKPVEVVEFRLWDKPGQVVTAMRAIGELKDTTIIKGDKDNPLEVRHSGKIEHTITLDINAPEFKALPPDERLRRLREAIVEGRN